LDSCGTARSHVVGCFEHANESYNFIAESRFCFNFWARNRGHEIYIYIVCVLGAKFPPQPSQGRQCNFPSVFRVGAVFT